MRRGGLGRPALLVWLVVVWVLLWGTVSWLVVLSGVLLAPMAVALCRLPAYAPQPRPRLGRLVRVVTGLGRDMLIASAQLTWTTLRRGPRTRAAVLAVRADHPTEVSLTAVANRVSLEPGTLVVEIDRDSDTLFIYVVDVGDDEDLERRRAQVQRQVDEVLLAFGESTASTRGGADNGSSA